MECLRWDLLSAFFTYLKCLFVSNSPTWFLYSEEIFGKFYLYSVGCRSGRISFSYLFATYRSERPMPDFFTLIVDTFVFQLRIAEGCSWYTSTENIAAVSANHHHHRLPLNSKTSLIDRCLYPWVTIFYKRSEYVNVTRIGPTHGKR